MEVPVNSSEETEPKIVEIDELLIDKPIVSKLEGRADHIYSLIISILQKQKLSCFAVYGEWGTGKTSICGSCYRYFKIDKLGKSYKIRSFTKLTENKSTYIVPIWFDAWRYQHEKEIYPALINEIASELQRQIVPLLKNDEQTSGWLNGTIKKIKRFCKASAKAVISGISVGYDPFVSFSGKDMLERNEKEMKRQVMPDISVDDEEIITSNYFEIWKLLNEIPNRTKIHDKRIHIVLFIDDLDRCLPNVAFDLIEKLKIWFEMDGYTTCMALNKDLIESVVSKHLQDHLSIDHGNAKMLARNYILKVVPFGIYTKKEEFEKIYKGVNTYKNKKPENIRNELINKNLDEILRKPINIEADFRSLINASNEIYIEHKLREMEENNNSANNKEK